MLRTFKYIERAAERNGVTILFFLHLLEETVFQVIGYDLYYHLTPPIITAIRISQ